jgi:hypothetical protein
MSVQHHEHAAASSHPVPAPSLIPGLIDASVTVSRDLDGSILFRMMIGDGSAQTEDSDHIELALDPQYADELIRALSDRGEAASDVTGRCQLPCCIGIHRPSRLAYARGAGTHAGR